MAQNNKTAADKNSGDNDLRKTAEYTECGFQIVKCPVCGSDTLDNFYICPHCGWEYDGTRGGEYSSANKCTADEYAAR